MTTMLSMCEDQLQQMIDQKIWESASIFAAFSIAGGNDSVKIRVLYGDALRQQDETKRAMAQYQAAADMLKRNDAGPEAAEIRYKIAQCYQILKQPDKAISTLEEVAAKQRTCAINILLGKLYVQNGNNRVAIHCYKDALKWPNCLEAIQPLLNLGVSSEEIMSCVAPTSNQFPWINQYIAAISMKTQHKDKDALPIFRNLTQSYAGNPYLLLPTAQLLMGMDDFDGSLYSFEQLRASDEYWIKNLDSMASILRDKSLHADLNKLTHDLLAIDIHRAEGWVAAALYWDAKRNREKAFECVEKAVQLDEYHVEGHILLGRLRLQSLKYEDALVTFRKAKQLSADMRAYQGLVESYIGLRKFKEAIATAKELLTLMPRNAKSFALMGTALAQVPMGLDKAKSIFEKAMSHDPLNVDTVIGYVDVLEAKHQTPAAISTLLTFLNRKPDPIVHCRVAALLAAQNMFLDAIRHYNSALGMDDTNEDARAGLEKLEKQMKGNDDEEVEEESRDESFDQFRR